MQSKNIFLCFFLVSKGNINGDLSLFSGWGKGIHLFINVYLLLHVCHHLNSLCNTICLKGSQGEPVPRPDWFYQPYLYGLGYLCQKAIQTWSQVFLSNPVQQ